MEKALAEIGKLREADQEAIAAIILDKIADERRWDESFLRSQNHSMNGRPRLPFSKWMIDLAVPVIDPVIP